MLKEIGLFFAGGACLLIPTVGLAIWNIVDTWRGHKAHVRLAEEGGYAPLHDVSHVISRIYSGEKNGRPFAFRVSPTISKSSAPDGGSTTSVNYHLQLLTPMWHPNLSGLALTAKPRLRSVPNCFEKIWDFERKRHSLNYNQQRALMAFATSEPHPAGSYSGKVRFKPFARSVSIFGRSDERVKLPSEIFPDAASLLVYDHPNANIDLETFEQFAGDFARLAESIESARIKCLN